MKKEWDSRKFQQVEKIARTAAIEAMRLYDEANKDYEPKDETEASEADTWRQLVGHAAFIAVFQEEYKRLEAAEKKS